MKAVSPAKEELKIKHRPNNNRRDQGSKRRKKLKAEKVLGKDRVSAEMLKVEDSEVQSINSKHYRTLGTAKQAQRSGRLG